MQSNRSCHKVKRPRWQRNRPVSNPQSGCICEIREICGLIIFLLRKKNSIDTVRGGGWQTRELLENFASQPPKHPNPRTSLAAGNYRSYASDKVQLNTCAANCRQRSVMFCRASVPDAESQRRRFTEWSRREASDIDGQLIRARERERTSQTPYNLVRRDEARRSQIILCLCVMIASE